LIPFSLARRVFHACCGFSFAIGSAKENGPGKTPGRFREEVLQQRYPQLSYFSAALKCVRENWRFGNPVERRAREYSPGGAN
jgi:hypothetical protein